MLARQDGETLNVLGEIVRIKLDGSATGGAWSLSEVEAQPNNGPPPHVHSREDETFYVLEGDFEFLAGDQKIRVGAGATVFAPRNVPHTYANVGTAPGRLLVILSPAGFEGFFRRVSREVTTMPPDLERLTAIAEEYGLQFLAP